jgi:asparagine synthase (glutamine-hydrolysing)
MRDLRYRKMFVAFYCPMGAVSGVVFIDGRPAGDAVATMLDTMPHRGPDGRGEWSEGPAAMGHLMLHTTPESLHETLPLVSESGRYVLTADARIDNRLELLSLLGEPNDQRPDSHIILALFEKFDTRWLHHAVGDFTFVVWDTAEQRLTCVRDHIGARPFYYVHQPGRLFAFATEIKALFALEGVAERLNEVRLGDYLADQTKVDRESTIFEGILRLPPGNLLRLEGGGLSRKVYYELPIPAPDGRSRTDEEWIEAFRETFRLAVESRTRSAFPVAAELSGGLDSSFVACLARDAVQKEGRGPLHTLSLVFDRFQECDERPYIEAVLNQGGFEPHYLDGDASGPLSHLDEIYRFVDDGYTGGNHHMVWLCHRAAREHGVRVLLDGFDGDTTVSHGLDYFAELAEAGRWAEFAKEAEEAAELLRGIPDQQSIQKQLASPVELVKAYGFRVLDQYAERGPAWRFVAAVNGMSRHFPVRPLQIYKRYWRKLAMPSRMVAARKRRARLRESGGALVNEEFARRKGLRARFMSFDQPVENSVRLRQRAVLSSDTFARAQEIMDHYAAANAVEVRHPFMDRRVIELCLAMPAGLAYRGGWTRFVMRKAMEGIVPSKIQWRPGKTNLANSYDYGLFDIDAALLDEYLDEITELRPYINEEEVTKMRVRAREQSGKDIWMLCMVATLSCWMRSRSRSEEPGFIEA